MFHNVIIIVQWKILICISTISAVNLRRTKWIHIKTHCDNQHMNMYDIKSDIKYVRSASGCDIICTTSQSIVTTQSVLTSVPWCQNPDKCVLHHSHYNQFTWPLSVYQIYGIFLPPNSLELHIRNSLLESAKNILSSITWHLSQWTYITWSHP